MGVQWRERIHPTRHWEGETWELLPWRTGKMFNDGVWYGGQSPGAEARTQEAPSMFGRLLKSECYLSHYLTENVVLTPVHSLFFFYSLLFCQKENNKKSIHLIRWRSDQFSSVHSLSRVRLSANPWTAARQASLSITNSRSSLKLMSIESVMPSNHLILCRPLLLLPSIFPSIRVFSKESVLRIRWPEYWSFRFNISPSNEHPGLISFRMDQLDLLEVQGTLKSLLQYHSSKASILQGSAFFIVQLSPPYMTTGKTIALTRWTLLTK